MAINTQKLLPPSSSSAIVKSGKIKINKKSKNNSNNTINIINAIKKELEKIKENLEKIYNLVLDNNKLTEKDLEVKRLSTEKLKFAEKEKELETKNPEKKDKESGVSIPKLGIFDRINRFITFTLLGWIAVRLVKYLPKLLEFSKNLLPVMEFFSSLTANFFKGLVDFIDFGYSAYDKVKEFVKGIGGESFESAFDGFSDNLNKFINLAIIAGMATMGGTDFGPGKKGGKPELGSPTTSKPGQGGRPKVTTTGGGGTGRPDLRNPLRQKPKITGTGGGAAGRPDLRNPLRQKPKITGAGGKVLGKLGGLGGRIPIIGGLVSFIISVMSGEPVGRAAAKAVGFSIGSALGTFVPVPFVGTILGGILGDIVGGALYDTLVSNKPKKPKVVAKKTGGQVTTENQEEKLNIKNSLFQKPKVTTRGGKTVGGVVQRKVQRVVRRVVTPPKSSPIDPGKSVGGKKKLQKMFPEPPDNTSNEKMNPYGTTVGTAEKMGEIPFLGPLFNIFGKTLLGDLPNKGDYQKVGMGIGAWINTAINQGKLQGNIVSAFSNGGMIEDIGRSDINGWVEKSVEELIKNKVTEAINELKRNLGLEPLSGGGGEPDDKIIPNADGMKDAVLYESEMDLLQRLVYAESGGEGKIGMSLVARSVLNRAGLIQSGKVGPGTFHSKGGKITEVITANKGGVWQYTPIKNGRINDQRTEKQMNDAKEAIKLAQNPNQLKALLKSEGISDGSIQKLLASTGFRNYDAAGYDASQDVNQVRYKKHTFNTAGNTELIIANSQVSTEIPEVGEMKLQNLKVIPGSHPDTGSGWTISGQTDESGRPIIFSKEAAFAFAKMIEDSKGVVTGKHIASSQRSKAKNDSLRGAAKNSLHLSGLAIDIHHASGSWIRKNGSKYGWVANDYSGTHGGHFEFKSKGRTINRRGGGTSRPPSSSGGSDNEKKKPESLNSKNKKIYLHWNVAEYTNPVGPYHAVFLGNGKKVQNHPYNTQTSHTYKRNKNAIGLGIAAMGGTKSTNKWVNPPTSKQLIAMANEAANLAKSMNWTKSDINKKNIMTHAEAAFLDGYGYGSGDPQTKWDMITLRQSDMNSQNTKSPGSKGGNEMRAMISQKMKDGGKIGIDIESIQTQASYEEGGKSIIMFIQPVLQPVAVPIGGKNRTTFIGGGSIVNNRDTSSGFVR